MLGAIVAVHGWNDDAREALDQSAERREEAKKKKK